MTAITVCFNVSHSVNSMVMIHVYEYQRSISHHFCKDEGHCCGLFGHHETIDSFDGFVKQMTITLKLFIAIQCISLSFV